jgi:hypothetical protein
MYNRDTPNILFVDETPSTIDTGYTYITVNNMDEMFSVSSQGKSCQETILELLNKHCSFIESINLTTLPIYNI